MQQNGKLGRWVPAAFDLTSEVALVTRSGTGLGRAITSALLAVGAPLLLALALLAAHAAAAPAVQQRERVEPIAATAPDWLLRALQHAAGELPPAAPTDDPHASALIVELVVADRLRGAATVPLEALVVEVLVAGRDANDPPWTAVARVAADGTAAFARVPEGRPHVLVLVPDTARVSLVPDPARYGLLFEPFSGGPFPHLALDEVQTSDKARVVRLHLVPGRTAYGIVELDAPAPRASHARSDEVALEGALAWVASPGWLQVTPLDEIGAFRWFDPRPALAAPFDPAAPSAGFLERLTGGVARPFGAAEGAWRECRGVPAPPFGWPFVIELTTEQSVQRARSATDSDPVATPANDSRSESEPRGQETLATKAAALARWRALRAVPIVGDGAAPHAHARTERAALAAELLSLSRADHGMEGFIAEACRLRLGGADSELPEWARQFPEQHALIRLAREWLALGPEGSEEAELELLARAEDPVAAILGQLDFFLSSSDVPLQLWIDVVAPRYPEYAIALAAQDSCLRAPKRSTARGAFPAGLVELDAPGLVAALRRRPSSTLGAELAPLVRAAPRDAVERLLTGFAELAGDETRGPAVRTGAVDLLLALGARTAEDGALLAESVLAALGDEPAGVAPADSILAALAPLAPARALADARAALDEIARDEGQFRAALQNAIRYSSAQREPTPLFGLLFGPLLVLGALAPAELAERARETPALATFAAAALLLEGTGALDARGLPHAFLERLLR